MSETLIIGGQTFENVAGFKAVDSSASTQVYIKPAGTKEISVSSNGTVTQDVAAYASAQISVAVPNTYAAADEGKVVSSGALVSQNSASYSVNGSYDTTLISSINIEVPGSEPTGTINIINNGMYNVGAYASASVLVPNTYSINDEGKVVSSGELVAQGSASYSSNGTYDTTLVSLVEVEVSGIEPSGTLEITVNGVYDVASYASASVEVSGTQPTGTIEIISNGVYDVAAYASASVATPEAAGSTTVVNNGTYDVAAYASVIVSIPLASGVGF